MSGESNPDLDEVRRVADAVLYEGYILYPYRASAQKNRSPGGAATPGLPDVTLHSRHSALAGVPMIGL